MTRYASNTEVSSDSSRMEIERTLRRYGAEQFMNGWDPNRAIVAFVIHGRQVRFILPMPDPNDRRFTHTPTRGTPRSATARAAEYEQAIRQSWRALNLVIKAKLEAVEAGIVSFDLEFMPHFVLPDGSTVADVVLPNIQRAYETGVVGDLLPDTPRAITAGGSE